MRPRGWLLSRSERNDARSKKVLTASLMPHFEDTFAHPCHVLPQRYFRGPLADDRQQWLQIFVVRLHCAKVVETREITIRPSCAVTKRFIFQLLEMTIVPGLLPREL